MTDALTHVAAFLAAGASALGRALSPIALLPAWLSVVLTGALGGAALLLLFKYTSNQAAIRAARRRVRAHRLAARLFPDRGALASQARAAVGAVLLLRRALVPLLVMAVPVALLLGQLGLWYQARPARVGEEVVVVVRLRGDAPEMPAVALELPPEVEDRTGPVRVFSKREVCWVVAARAPGAHRLRFRVGDETFHKELTAGAGFARVGPVRPDWDAVRVLLNPRERPLPRASVVRWIAVEYPPRPGRFTGTDNWVLTWFAVALVTGLLLRKRFGVSL